MAALDAEHSACAFALQKLAQSPTCDSIRRVIDLYSAHFDHEQELLDGFLYSENAKAEKSLTSFNAEALARRSHFADHERMLDELREQLLSLTKTGGVAPASFVDDVLRSFERHANNYDMAYADRLSSELGKVSA